MRTHGPRLHPTSAFAAAPAWLRDRHGASAPKRSPTLSGSAAPFPGAAPNFATSNPVLLLDPVRSYRTLPPSRFGLRPFLRSLIAPHFASSVYPPSMRSGPARLFSASRGSTAALPAGQPNGHRKRRVRGGVTVLWRFQKRSVLIKPSAIRYVTNYRRLRCCRRDQDISAAAPKRAFGMLLKFLGSAGAPFLRSGLHNIEAPRAAAVKDAQHRAAAPAGRPVCWACPAAWG